MIEVIRSIKDLYDSYRGMSEKYADVSVHYPEHSRGTAIKVDFISVPRWDVDCPGVRVNIASPDSVSFADLTVPVLPSLKVSSKTNYLHHRDLIEALYKELSNEHLVVKFVDVRVLRLGFVVLKSTGRHIHTIQLSRIKREGSGWYEAYGKELDEKLSRIKD